MFGCSLQISLQCEKEILVLDVGREINVYYCFSMNEWHDVIYQMLALDFKIVFLKS